MLRILLWIMLCMVGFPAYADPVDDIASEIFEDDAYKVKAEYRICSTDSECTAAVSLCRWRPVNHTSRKIVVDASKKYTPECKWPPLPPRAPIARCVESLCEILPDGRYY